MEESKRQLLTMLVSNPGFEVLLDLMEAECEKAEKELLTTDVGDPQRVLAMHNRAQAFAFFFERFQKRINNEISQYQPAVKQMTPLEIIERQVNQ